VSCALVAKLADPGQARLGPARELRPVLCVGLVELASRLEVRGLGFLCELLDRALQAAA